MSEFFLRIIRLFFFPSKNWILQPFDLNQMIYQNYKQFKQTNKIHDLKRAFSNLKQ